jgi:hypothetical protein
MAAAVIALQRKSDVNNIDFISQRFIVIDYVIL